MKTICISAGHGAGDPGVVNKNLKEADLTIKIASRAVGIIRNHGVDCLYVPDNLTLVQTIQWINARASQITITVDVHINSGGGSGVEGWNYQGGPNESDKLSQFLADACAAESGLPNRGIKDETTNRYKKLGFIHDTTPIAALIECGFIDGDYNFLNNPESIEKLARGVARGCLSYLGLPWKPELLNPKPQIDPKDTQIKELEAALVVERQKVEELTKQVGDPRFKQTLIDFKETLNKLPL